RRVPTFAAILRGAGWQTVGYVTNPFMQFGLESGFAEYEYLEGPQGEAPALARAAVARLGRHRTAGERFFLFLHFIALPDPLVRPEPYFSMSPAEGGGARVAAHRYDTAVSTASLEGDALAAFLAHRRALYDGALRAIDDAFGRVLGALRTLRL